MGSISTRIRNILSPFIVDVDELLSPGRGVWSETISIYGALTHAQWDLLAMLIFILVGSRNSQDGWQRLLGSVACDQLYSPRQPPDHHPSSPPSDTSIHHSSLLDTVKICAYGAGLYRSKLSGFMSLTMFCFAQNHHGSYARSGKGHWYRSLAFLYHAVAYSPTSAASSALPYRRAPPTWLKTTHDDVVEHICKLARKGLTPSQIGVTLRDSHGIPQVRFVTGNKILRILKSNG